MSITTTSWSIPLAHDINDPLEAWIEKKFCGFVKDDGGVTRKMNGMGFNSWPDRICLKPGVVRPLWVEFKRRGMKATPLQKENHKMLRRMGQAVVVCDTYEKAVKAYRQHYR